MTSHILLDEDSEHGLRCLHCYDIHSPVLPMTVERHIDECRGFVLMHKHCQKRQGPSPQLDLPNTDRPVAAKCCGQRVRCVNCPIPAHVFEQFPGALPDWMAPDETAPFADTERERPEPVFETLWPRARDHSSLRGQLAVALGNRGKPTPTLGQLQELTMSSENPLFDEIAHWSRVELAHMNVTEYPEMRIPARLPMPEALAEVLGVKGKKRGARPLTSKRRVSK